MSKRYFRNSLFILASLFLVGAAAGRNDSQDKEKREPIVITASRMEADKLGG